MPFNILYIHSHDTGRMIEPYGHAISSPKLAEFAKSAAIFRQAFTVSPTCSPSRCALLTGQYAHRCGMLGLAHRGFQMPDYTLHLAHVLKKAGYATALAGNQHETSDPGIVSSYYDQWLEEPKAGPGANVIEKDRLVAERAVRFLERKHRQPFFISVGFSSTHRRFPEAPPEAVGETRPFPGMTDTPETRKDVADFQASLHVLDECMGRVFASLKNAGRDRDTIVICTTDHGPPFPFMKCTLRDDGMGVFLMLRIPGERCAGRRIDAMVTHLDVFPTLMELLNIDPPHALDGASLMPLLRDEKKELHDAIFAETNFHSTADPQRAVRTPCWKYIRRYLEGPIPLPNMDNSPTKKMLYEAGAFARNMPREQLFDLLADPGEQRDLAGDDNAQATLLHLRKRMDEWMQATGDPLLAGHIDPPAGGNLTERMDYSPAGGVPEEIQRSISSRRLPTCKSPIPLSGHRRGVR